ncbi:hypothetical protein SNEBB_003090 [Seison nebaliae]|nr:hypothetical protein SNEBB_003090 [Seison nebaliae]
MTNIYTDSSQLIDNSFDQLKQFQHEKNFLFEIKSSQMDEVIKRNKNRITTPLKSLRYTSNTSRRSSTFSRQSTDDLKKRRKSGKSSSSKHFTKKKCQLNTDKQLIDKDASKYLIISSLSSPQYRLKKQQTEKEKLPFYRSSLQFGVDGGRRTFSTNLSVFKKENHNNHQQGQSECSNKLLLQLPSLGIHRHISEIEVRKNNFKNITDNDEILTTILLSKCQLITKLNLSSINLQERIKRKSFDISIIFQMNYLNSLNLSNNNLDENIFDFINKNPLLNVVEISELSLSNNSFCHLPNCFSSGRMLVCLKRIDIDHNRLVNLKDFNEYRTMKRLNLDNNRICGEILLSEWKFAESLEELYLKNNNILSIHFICCLKNVRIFDLSSNQLTSITSDYFNLTNLQMLLLSNNQLVSLPNLSISVKKRLRRKNIQIQQITNESSVMSFGSTTTQLSTSSPIDNDQKLIYLLDLSNNRITQFTDYLFDIAYQLDLSCNFIQYIPIEYLKRYNDSLTYSSSYKSPSSQYELRLQQQLKSFLHSSLHSHISLYEHLPTFNEKKKEKQKHPNDDEEDEEEVTTKKNGNGYGDELIIDNIQEEELKHEQQKKKKLIPKIYQRHKIISKFLDNQPNKFFDLTDNPLESPPITIFQEGASAINQYCYDQSNTIDGCMKQSLKLSLISSNNDDDDYPFQLVMKMINPLLTLTDLPSNRSSNFIEFQHHELLIVDTVKHLKENINIKLLQFPSSLTQNDNDFSILNSTVIDRHQIILFSISIDSSKLKDEQSSSHKVKCFDCERMNKEKDKFIIEDCRSEYVRWKNGDNQRKKSCKKETIELNENEMKIYNQMKRSLESFLLKLFPESIRKCSPNRLNLSKMKKICEGIRLKLNKNVTKHQNLVNEFEKEKKYFDSILLVPFISNGNSLKTFNDHLTTSLQLIKCIRYHFHQYFMELINMIEEIEMKSNVSQSQSEKLKIYYSRLQLAPQFCYWQTEDKQFLLNSFNSVCGMGNCRKKIERSIILLAHEKLDVGFGSINLPLPHLFREMSYFIDTLFMNLPLPYISVEDFGELLIDEFNVKSIIYDIIRFFHDDGKFFWLADKYFGDCRQYIFTQPQIIFSLYTSLARPKQFYDLNQKKLFNFNEKFLKCIDSNLTAISLQMLQTFWNLYVDNLNETMMNELIHLLIRCFLITYPIIDTVNELKYRDQLIQQLPWLKEKENELRNNVNQILSIDLPLIDKCRQKSRIKKIVVLSNLTLIKSINILYKKSNVNIVKNGRQIGMCFENSMRFPYELFDMIIVSILFYTPFALTLHHRNGVIFQSIFNEPKLTLILFCTENFIEIHFIDILLDGKEGTRKLFEYLWQLAQMVLKCIENIFRSYPGFILQRKVRCPDCYRFTFPGEWLNPKELQAQQTTECIECQSIINTDYLVQPNENKRKNRELLLQLREKKKQRQLNQKMKKDNLKDD